MPNIITRTFSVLSQRLFPEEKALGDVQDYYPRNIDGVLHNAFLGNPNLDVGSAFSLYRKSSAVATAVNMIAGKIEELKPVIARRDGEMIGAEGPVVDFLVQPNGFQPYREFIGQVARHWLITHNFYLFGAGSVSQLPVTMFNPHPSTATPITTRNDNFPEQYSLSSGDGEDGTGIVGLFKREFGPDGLIRYYEGPLRELYHVRGFSSRERNLVGDSPLESIILEVQQHIKGMVHNTSLLEKGARPSAVFKFADKMTKEQYEVRTKQLNKIFSGAENAGRIVALSAQDLEIMLMGNMSNVDMDFAVLNAAARETVFTHYAIPSPLVTQARQTFDNYGTAILALYDDAVCPNADRIFEALSMFLLPRAGIDHRQFMLTYDKTEIAALRLRVLEEIEKRKEIGVETVNELREFIPGRDPYTQGGGDEIYQPATQVPLGTDMMAERGETEVDEAARIAGDQE